MEANNTPTYTPREIAMARKLVAAAINRTQWEIMLPSGDSLTVADAGLADDAAVIDTERLNMLRFRAIFTGERNIDNLLDPPDHEAAVWLDVDTLQVWVESPSTEPDIQPLAPVHVLWAR